VAAHHHKQSLCFPNLGGVGDVRPVTHSPYQDAAYEREMKARRRDHERKTKLLLVTTMISTTMKVVTDAAKIASREVAVREGTALVTAHDMRPVIVMAGEDLFCTITVSPLGGATKAEVETQAAAGRAAQSSSRWLCSVCKRDNPATHEKCSICSAGRGYTLGNKQIESTAVCPPSLPLQPSRRMWRVDLELSVGTLPCWVKFLHTFKQHCRVTALADDAITCKC
jgi:hypothetical protein